MPYKYQTTYQMMNYSDPNNNSSNDNNKQQYLRERCDLSHGRILTEPNGSFKHNNSLNTRENDSCYQESLASYRTSSPKSVSPIQRTPHMAATSPIAQIGSSNMFSEGCMQSLPVSQFSNQLHVNDHKPDTKSEHQSTPLDRKSMPHHNISPVVSVRLQPIRQKMNKAVFNITENGFICLEFFKVRDGKDGIYEVLWITPKGHEVIILTSENYLQVVK